MTKTYKIHTNKKQVSDNQWSDLLKNQTANYFQTPQALDFFETTGLETYFIALEKEEKIKVVIAGVIQKEKGLKAMLTSRAIIFGGPIIDTTATAEDLLIVMKELVNTLKNKAIYIEIRNLNDYSGYKSIFEQSKFEYVPHLNFHLDCTDDQSMRKRMSSSKLRQVKKSIKEGATIIEAKDVDHIKQYYGILENLYKTKVKTPLPDLDFFITLFHQKSVKFLLVEYQDTIIGGIVCPILEQKVIYEWFVCGKDGVFKNVYPSILSTWAAMEYAQKNNIPRFDFMGAGKPDEDYGVREFKSKFGGELVEHGRFLFVVNPLLYNAGKTAVKILKKI